MKINVHVKPRAKKTTITKDIDGNFFVSVTAPPIGGKANKAVQEVLADFFDVAKSRVQLIYGAKTKMKVFEILTEK